MAKLSASDVRWIEDTFGMSGGYVMDMTNRSFADLVRLEIGENVDDPQFAVRGPSKANRLRCLMEVCDEAKIASLLKALWAHREDRQWAPGDMVEPRPLEVKRRLMQVVEEMERRAGRSDTSPLDIFIEGITLEELVGAIERDVLAGKHAAALDRLHTYCMKRIGHWLTTAGVDWQKDEPLHSRAGKYAKHLAATRKLRPMTMQILRNSSGLLQSFNDIRNNGSFAHDNEIVSANEARLIFETVVGLLRFLGTVEVKSNSIENSDALVE